MNYEALFINFLADKDLYFSYDSQVHKLTTECDPDLYIQENSQHMKKNWADLETKWHDLLEANGYDFDGGVSS